MSSPGPRPRRASRTERGSPEGCRTSRTPPRRPTERLNMRRIVALSLALALSLQLTLAPAVLAGTKVHPGAQIEVWHPDEWKDHVDGDTLILQDADKEVWVGLEV